MAKEGPSKAVAFLLWMGWPLGLGGLHRFYLGKPISGTLYLLTWGFLGIGQIIDLFRLPTLVRKQNLALLKEEGEAMAAAGLLPPSQQSVNRQKLLHEASRHGGRLSVTQAVMATGQDFAEVEAMLDEMVRSGYVGLDNDPETGHVVYYFPQLAP